MNEIVKLLLVFCKEKQYFCRKTNEHMKYPKEIITEKWGDILKFSCPCNSDELFFDIDCITHSEAVDINATIIPHRHDFYQP